MSLRARTLTSLPVTDTRRQVAGIPTAVLEGGDGPPLVLLHGPGEFAALWGHVIPDLVTTHRVIAPDLPGHGDSGLPDGRLDTRRTLTWLRDLVDATCDTPPDLVGHLLGGAVAARFAAAHPDRVRHLVLVDTFGLRPTRPAMRFLLPLLAFTARPTERSRDRFLAQCFVDFDGVRDGMGDRWDPAAAYELAWARTRTGKKALRSLMPRFGLRRVPPAELAGISAPTSLVWGRHDLQTPLHVAETASARYGWPLHVIDACADDPFVERPREALTSLRSALDTSAGRGVAS